MVGAYKTTISMAWLLAKRDGQHLRVLYSRRTQLTLKGAK